MVLKYVWDKQDWWIEIAENEKRIISVPCTRIVWKKEFGEMYYGDSFSGFLHISPNELEVIE